MRDVLPALSGDPNHAESIKLNYSEIKPKGVYARVTRNTDQPGGISDTTNGSGELVDIWAAGSATIDLTAYKIYENSDYIGRIDGRKSPLRFVPSSESQEEPINRIN